MEAVRAFNNELSGLYETKPPISRAKMAQLTKCAIKAIKFYKHVVQSVEKFIQKCKPQYKVPGLYVIDSVVRQSRHQFGSQKDVFAPRFTRNIITTFQNLFKCPADERSKIVRVLNLWQKNEVFPSEIIQPLLDLAADPTKPSLIATAQVAVDSVLVAMGKSINSQQQQQQQQLNVSGSEPQQDMEFSQSTAESMLATQNDMLNTVTQLLQQSNSDTQSLSAQQQQLQQLQLLQQQLIQQTELMQLPAGGAPIIDANLLAQIQALTNQLLQRTESKPDEGGFNKKLLDFDYGESDDEDDRRQPEPNLQGDVQNILNDTGLMQQIHQVSQTIQKNNEYSAEITEQEHRRRVLEQQQAEFDQQIAQGMPPPPLPYGSHPPMPEPTFNQEEGEYTEEQVNDEDFREHQQFKDREDRERRDRKHKSRDRSRSRTPKRRRRSRSRSRDRKRRSRSKDRHKRSRSKERERKEKERERKKKALPAVRANFVTICTTTIWIGHLNKFTSEEELKTEIERYGAVESISMVPPRGCAYVVMENRRDAYKAIDRLKGNKLNGSSLKTAWAQSTGIRDSDFKDSWDLDEGAMYIPWDSLPSDFMTYLDGAIIDADSLPENLQSIPTEKVKKAPVETPLSTQSNQVNVQIPAMMSMPGQPPMPPPMMGMMPPSMQGLMPGMMMPMPRPMMPGMPPPSLPMTPGSMPNMGMPPGSAPNSMIPGSPQVAAIRPPVASPMGSMNMTNSDVANTLALAQTIHNIMSSTSGLIPNSSTASPRPTGFAMGGPHRFGFNPNMPPPGFRMPPPGFGSPMRSMMPPGPMPPGKPGDLNVQGSERLSLVTGSTQKQTEMVWPPDSNEKDEENEEDEDIHEVNSDVKNSPAGQFRHGPLLRPPPGHEQPPVRMLCPPPPGVFPPGGPRGPVQQPWGMNRMAGPRHMGPFLGDGGPRGGPRMRHPLAGGPMMRGPRPPLLGNMPGSRFPRFSHGGPGDLNPNVRGPVSLFDLDVKPTEDFEGESFGEDGEEYDNFEENLQRTDNFNEYNDNTDENEVESNNTYPFNKWQSVNRNHFRHNDKRHQSRDESFRDGGKDFRNRDRSSGKDGGDRNRDGDDKGRNHKTSVERESERSRESDRDGRDRERRDWHDREHGDRDHVDRDEKRERKDNDGSERPHDRDKQKIRKSRWGNWEEEMKLLEMASKENVLNKDAGIETNVSENKTETSGVSENQTDTSDAIENVETSLKIDKDGHCDDTRQSDNVSDNNVNSDEGKETIDDCKTEGSKVENEGDEVEDKMQCFSGTAEIKIEKACEIKENKTIAMAEENEIENFKDSDVDRTVVKKFEDMENEAKNINAESMKNNNPDISESEIETRKSVETENEKKEVDMDLEEGEISS